MQYGGLLTVLELSEEISRRQEDNHTARTLLKPPRSQLLGRPGEGPSQGDVVEEVAYLKLWRQYFT